VNNFNDIKLAARGKWPFILADSGINPGTLQNRHGYCPGCGGTDRFRFDDKNGDGTFYCNGGGNPVSGDGFKLIQHVTGCTPKNSLEQVAGLLGYRPEVEPIHKYRETRPHQKPSTQGYALHIWASTNRNSAYVRNHPYSIEKNINNSFGAGRHSSARLFGKSSDSLVVPIRDLYTNDVIAVQLIGPDGTKQTYGSFKGHALPLGNTLDCSLRRFVVEGWATGVWFFKHYQGHCCIYVAFGCSNMMNVATWLINNRPGSDIYIANEASKQELVA